jgi:signal recognition particle GTPase
MPSVSKMRQQVTRQQQKKRNARRVKQKEPNLYDLSNQLQMHTKQLSKIDSIVQQLPKYLKNTDTQSRIIKELYTSTKQLQRQIGQIQKSMQKKKY